MGEEAVKTVIPESVLKKRKREEEWALAKKQDLEATKKKNEKELIRLKREAKLKGGFYVDPEAKLLFIIRIRGTQAMGKNVLVLGLTLLVLFGAVSSASTSTSPAKIINGIFSNAVSFFMKWLWSLKSTTKTAISGRPMMKFESGYTVETVFDGSKLGIEPYSVEVLPGGELLVLNSANSNLYRISASLSLCECLYCFVYVMDWKYCLLGSSSLY
ncbi:hypothetical protein SO802_008749 [Lithocarpus litseifolius]|uniref:Uncharacterized protein n=1 Tax=Lithocarpus litseifolius TaxID=425828 RepID=A0AAW2DBN5_9ROSI